MSGMRSQRRQVALDSAAQYQLRGDLLTLTVIGVTDNAEIEAALAKGVSSAGPGARLRLLWDGRRGVPLLSAEDFGIRIGFIASLAAQGTLVRGALVVPATHQQATVDFFRREIPRALDPLPVAVFVDEAEALEWLGGGEG